MTQLTNLVKQIDELDPVDREQLAYSLASGMFPIALTRFWSSVTHEYPSIVSTPGVCGGDARFIRTRIPVWSVARMRQLGFSDMEILRSYPTLRAEDLVEARAYVARYPEEIEKAIRENEQE